jgi:hypothetical protein
MSKRLNKRQQREAEELAELQRAQVQAQASVRPEVDEDEEEEQSAELNANKEEEEDEAESEQEEEQPTRKSGGKVLNPFAAVSLGSKSHRVSRV